MLPKEKPPIQVYASFDIKKNSKMSIGVILKMRNQALKNTPQEFPKLKVIWKNCYIPERILL